LIAAAGLAIALALPAINARASGSEVFCVNDSGCSGTTEASLTAALSAADAAEPGSETIDLGPGNYSAASGFADTTSGSNAISIVGSGEGSTTVTATNTGARVLNFYPDEDASISDLTVALPSGASVGANYPAGVTNVAFVGTGSSGATALWTGGTSTFTNVTISMPLGTSSVGLYRPNGTVAASGLTITADTGIWGNGSNDSYKDVRIFSDATGIDLGQFNGTLASTSTITESEIVMTGAGTALDWDEDGASSVTGTLDASFLTIVGDGTAGSIGVASTAAGSGAGALDLSNSIVQGFSSSLDCNTTDSGAALSVDYSDFDPASETGSCASSITAGAGNINANPLLDTLGDGDRTLSYNSPAIDAGDPTITGPLTDLLGNPRPVDGGSGTVRVDMGAFEYQHPAPIAVASASPNPAEVGTPITFSPYGTSDAAPNDTFSFMWTFDDGESARQGKAQHAFTTAGMHSATLTVTDSAGLTSTAQTQVLVIAPPTLTALSFAPAKFRTRPAAHGHSKTHPLGSTIRYTLSQPASVAIMIARAETGAKSGASCVTRKAKDKRPKCTRYVTLGTVGPAAGMQGPTRRISPVASTAQH
jgi:hypothetical protein